MFCCEFCNCFLQGRSCLAIGKPVFIINYPKIFIAVCYDCVGWGCDYVVVNAVFYVIFGQVFY